MTDNETKTVEEAEASSTESKQTKRINKWLNILEILKEILTCLKH